IQSPLPSDSTTSKTTPAITLRALSMFLRLAGDAKFLVRRETTTVLPFAARLPTIPTGVDRFNEQSHRVDQPSIAQPRQNLAIGNAGPQSLLLALLQADQGRAEETADGANVIPIGRGFIGQLLKVSGLKLVAARHVAERRLA